MAKRMTLRELESRQQTMTQFKQKPDIEHVIGVDPGVNTGLAVYHRGSGEIIYSQATKFAPAISYITNNYQKAVIIIETSASKRVWCRQGATKGERDAIAINVGFVMREAQLLAQTLKFVASGNGFEYQIETPPPQRGLTKLSAEKVKAITGYSKRTNNHERDAIMLCYGR